MPRITWMTYLRISFDQIPKHYLESCPSSLHSGAETDSECQEPTECVRAAQLVQEIVNSLHVSQVLKSSDLPAQEPLLPLQSFLRARAERLRCDLPHQRGKPSLGVPLLGQYHRSPLQALQGSLKLKQGPGH